VWSKVRRGDPPDSERHREQEPDGDLHADAERSGHGSESVTKITGLPARRSDAGRNQPEGGESAEKYSISASMAGSSVAMEAA
jgi:hypothetical protein